MENVDILRNQLPAYAKDIKLNLQSVLSQSKLSPTRAYGSAIASAASVKHSGLQAALIADAKAAGVSAETIEDALAAAALMAMNNIYYRFRHFMHDTDYPSMRAGLRMTRIARPASEKVDFELFSLAVSAINGCEMCIKSHEKVVVEHGLSKDEVHDSVRIASTIAAAACALEAGSPE